MYGESAPQILASDQVPTVDRTDGSMSARQHCPISGAQNRRPGAIPRFPFERSEFPSDVWRNARRDHIGLQNKFLKTET